MSIFLTDIILDKNMFSYLQSFKFSFQIFTFNRGSITTNSKTMLFFLSPKHMPEVKPPLNLKFYSRFFPSQSITEGW